MRSWTTKLRRSILPTRHPTVQPPGSKTTLPMVGMGRGRRSHHRDTNKPVGLRHCGADPLLTRWCTAAQSGKLTGIIEKATRGPYDR